MPGDMLHLKIRKQLGNFAITLEEQLPLAGVTAIFGPSGSGKSTLLRLIAGHERPDNGTIKHADVTWVDTQKRLFLPPHQRPVGYTAQGGHLLRHLSVLGNLQYADRRNTGTPLDLSIQSVCTAFDLDALIDRKTNDLSGGEVQRVALAQAILRRPKLLLLDEPLTGLDEARKQEILPYLRKLKTRFGIPMLYVSHNTAEVAALADQTLILNAGQAVSFGKTETVMNAQSTLRDRDGAHVTILSGQINAVDARLGLLSVATPAGEIRVCRQDGLTKGSPVRVLIGAREVALCSELPTQMSVLNALRCTVKSINPGMRPETVIARLGLGETELTAAISLAASENMGLRCGMALYALLGNVRLA